MSKGKGWFNGSMVQRFISSKNPIFKNIYYKMTRVNNIFIMTKLNNVLYIIKKKYETVDVG